MSEATMEEIDDRDEADTEQEAPASPVERLKDAAQTLLQTVTGRAVDLALEKVDGLTDRLSGVAENGGVGLSSALGGGTAMLQGENPVMGAIKGGLSSAKDKVLGAVGLGGGDDDGGGGGSGSGGGAGGQRGKFKFMNIVEETDVGVPIRVAYDQWTQFADFPSFMKKLHSVEQESEEKTTWRAQVFWSKRTWNATIIEQVPDSHIVWRSGGAKGYVNGIVSFHELAPSLTKVLLVMEYYPVGLFEKTGNIWRAVGRRARLEFKHYRRHVMVETLVHREELEGWRGEIRDSEVVKTHEEALEEEEREREESGEYDDGYDDSYDDHDGYDDEYDSEDYDDEPDETYDDEIEAASDEDLDEEPYDEAAADEPADELAEEEYADEAEEPADEVTAEDVEEPEPDDASDIDDSEDSDDSDDSDDAEDNSSRNGRSVPRRRRAGAR